MTNNALEAQKHLQANNLSIEFIDMDDGGTIARLREALSCGIRLEVVVFFGENDRTIKIITNKYIAVPDHTEKDLICSLLNDLNSKHMFQKFYLKDGNEIVIADSLFFIDNFNPEVLFATIGNMLGVADQEYATIMKTIWS